MSGARTQLAEALLEHARRCDPNHPGYGNCRCGFPVEMPDEHASHVADVLRSLPGLAITEVPLDTWGRPVMAERGISRKRLLAHMPRLVYAGPPGGVRQWRLLPYQLEGVYHLFDLNGEVVYIGKTCNPPQRFKKHREKPWWSSVSWLNYYTLTCYDHPHEPCPRASLESAAFRWEWRAIKHLKPPNNVAGVAHG